MLIYNRVLGSTKLNTLRRRNAGGRRRGTPAYFEQAAT